AGVRPGAGPPSPLRQARGGRGRDLLPGLRPRQLRDRRCDPRRRRPDAVPALGSAKPTSTIRAMRSLTLARAAGAGFLLAAIALFVLYLIPSNHYYVFLPDRAHPLEPLVRISGEHATASGGGGVYFVDVRFRKARLLE